MNIEDTKRNKNLLRVAAELAGKGTGHGEMGLDDIEVLRTNGAENTDQLTAEDVENFANKVLAELVNLEQNLDFELVDEELDFAIDKIIDKYLAN